MKLAAIALALALSTSPTEILISARDAKGDAPELAAAVSRALVATGATVILGPRSSDLCGARCVRLLVVEQEGRSRVRVEATQGKHAAAAYVDVPASASLFERGRAVAVQARLMIDWSVEEPQAVKPKPPPAPVPEVAPEPEVVEVAPEPPLPPAPAPTPVVQLPPVVIAPPRPSVPMIPLVTSGIAALAAGTLGILALDRYDALSDRSLPVDDARRMRDQGKTFQNVGIAAGGVAVVAAAVALGMWLAGNSHEGAAP